MHVVRTILNPFIFVPLLKYADEKDIFPTIRAIPPKTFAAPFYLYTVLISPIDRDRDREITSSLLLLLLLPYIDPHSLKR